MRNGGGEGQYLSSSNRNLVKMNSITSANAFHAMFSNHHKLFLCLKYNLYRRILSFSLSRSSAVFAQYMLKFLPDCLQSRCGSNLMEKVHMPHEHLIIKNYGTKANMN